MKFAKGAAAVIIFLIGLILLTTTTFPCFSFWIFKGLVPNSCPRPWQVQISDKPEQPNPDRLLTHKFRPGEIVIFGTLSEVKNNYFIVKRGHESQIIYLMKDTQYYLTTNGLVSGSNNKIASTAASPVFLQFSIADIRIGQIIVVTANYNDFTNKMSARLITYSP